MTTITTRAGKGSPLTSTEVDSNFTNLNTDKQEVLSEGSFANGDKTKLDGIASSATANPNAIDAVVDDTTPQLGGDLDTNSHHILVDYGHYIQWPNSNNANSPDLRINTSTYGANIFSQNLSMNIGTEATNGIVSINNQIFNQGYKQAAAFQADGYCLLSHNGSQKFITETTGIKVTGTLNLNDAYTFPTADGSANQVLQTDGNGALSFATVSGGGGGGITTGKAIAMAIVFG